jgi:hypothetical protein
VCRSGERRRIPLQVGAEGIGGGVQAHGSYYTLTGMYTSHTLPDLLCRFINEPQSKTGKRQARLLVKFSRGIKASQSRDGNWKFSRNISFRRV